MSSLVESSLRYLQKAQATMLVALLYLVEKKLLQLLLRCCTWKRENVMVTVAATFQEEHQDNIKVGCSVENLLFV
ncbi:hypothetical protein K1719_040700 [Acacia pycnantha]|nr:hypothetical protein K1719_040700 [Acacia pycnantha]